MLEYGLIACFSPVIKINIGSVNISSMVPVRKKFGCWKMEKKNRVLATQKVAKIGNIGKKTQAGDIDYVRYLNMQKVNLN